MINLEINKSKYGSFQLYHDIIILQLHVGSIIQ